jgi:rhodanese-related sulfurtransferase
MPKEFHAKLIKKVFSFLAILNPITGPISTIWQRRKLMKHSPKFLELCDSAKSRIEETNSETVKQWLDRGEDFTLIDVREESEWRAGHLPKAIHLSKGMIEVKIEKIVPDFDRKMILYCGGGFRSALAADNLKKMGYKNVISMDGGFRAWQSAGFPIEND